MDGMNKQATGQEWLVARPARHERANKTGLTNHHDDRPLSKLIGTRRECSKACQK